MTICSEGSVVRRGERRLQSDITMNALIHCPESPAGPEAGREENLDYEGRGMQLQAECGKEMDKVRWGRREVSAGARSTRERGGTHKLATTVHE